MERPALLGQRALAGLVEEVPHVGESGLEATPVGDPLVLEGGVVGDSNRDTLAMRATAPGIVANPIDRTGGVPVDDDRPSDPATGDVDDRPSDPATGDVDPGPARPHARRPRPPTRPRSVGRCRRRGAPPTGQPQ